ncbi:MAG TPA: UDP-N-acetylmuramoyl-L-alanyl-D-glutamate--2,6-diaminopimelate ligase [Bryobacteraceae bacterium]|jgi:UDP-N-acetylmuramoyl-L-alanyl-D-glutamate--2,6-diaminopimelate ligase|nr:UDP-N-acetylmuramoyl-L-alanyl-D-glutamate--2,6-diaminopimelate ligase [Bryobacteraceae bacterium]
MKFAQVFETIPTIGAIPATLAEAEVRGLAYDSRKVEPGFLFFAFPGAKTDGAHYAAAALEKAALAVVSDRPAYGQTRHAPWVQVGKGRQALAVAARNFYGKPDERILLSGVTGTNGKTTSTSLIDSILHAAGKTTALIGTIEYKLAGRTLPAVNTTPESLDLFRMFAELEQAGGTHATLEASSHALDLGRIYAMQFHTVAFTNFTRDHLDYHGTMEEYFAAKQLLFTPASVPPPRFAIVNADDPELRHLKTDPQTELLRFGREHGDVHAENVQSDFSGLRFDVVTERTRFRVESSLVGHINIYNILLASAVALTYDISEEHIQKGLADLQRVPGRFERVEEGQPFTVVVDYAHTDDALRNVIAVARGLRPKRVITLFGCGGDRDRAKRPLMGVAAAEMSDYVVLTSDNPRSEDPLAIMNDALVGLSRYDTPHVAEPDRERAIRKALETAAPGDVVILAGKGHETYQILRDGPIPFDDREVARRVLRSFGFSKAAVSSK